MSKVIKKALAILCAVMLLPFGSFVNGAGNIETTYAADTAELQKLTLLDAGVSDSTNMQLYEVSLPVDTLDGTLFSVRLCYNAEGSRMHFGAKDGTRWDYSGLSFRLDGGRLIIGNELAGGSGNVLTNMPETLVALDSQIAGVGDTFENVEFLLQISTEFVDNDGDGVKNDIKLGVYINGNLYDNQYYYIKDNAQQLGHCINFNEVNMGSFGSYDDGENELTEWTIRDVGMADGWRVSETGTPMENGTLVNSAFSALVNFPTERLNFVVGKAENDGLLFQPEYGANVRIVYSNAGIPLFEDMLTPEKAGCTLVGNDNLKLTVTVEDVRGRGLKFGIYFNDVLYDGKYYYAVGTSEQKKNVSSYSWDWTGDKWIYLESTVKSSETIGVPTGKTELTLLDAGVSDSANTQLYGATLPVNTLNGTLFSTRLCYSEAGSRFHYGATNEGRWIYDGVAFRLESDGKLTMDNEAAPAGLTNMPSTLVKIDPQVAGVGVTFKDVEFLLQISTEFVDRDGDGMANDIKLSVFINGKLYANRYFYIKDNAEQLGTVINFNEVNMASFGSYVDSSGITPELEEWTIEDVYLPNGYYGSVTASQHSGSLSNTSFSTMLNIPSDVCTNIWLGKELDGFLVSANTTWDGKEKCLTLGYYQNEVNHLNVKLDSNIACADFVDNPSLKLTITVEKLEGKGSRIGVYFNDKLYNDKWFYITADPEKTVRNIQMIQYGGGDIYLGSPNAKESGELPLDYERLTLMDANIGDNVGQEYGTMPVSTLDKVLFSARLKYSNDSSRFHYGVTSQEGEDAYGGISFRLEGDNLMVSNEIGEKGLSNMPFQLMVLNPKTAGINGTFKDTEFVLQVSIAFVDRDGDGNKNDIKLGVFINGKLYDGQYLYIKDNAGDLGTGINFLEGDVTYASYDYQRVFTELTSKDFGLDSTAVLNQSWTGTYDTNSLAATAIEMRLKFPKAAGNKLYIGGKNTGVRFESAGDGSIKVSYVDAGGRTENLITINERDANVSSLTNSEQKWRFTFRIYEAGNENRVKLGIYVNGCLYNSTFITLKNVDLSCLKRVIGVDSNGGEFVIDAPEYEELTIQDFNMKDKQVNDPEKLPYSYFNFYDKDILDGTAVTALVCFGSTDGNRFALGTYNNAYNNGWDGLSVVSMKDGRLWVIFADREGQTTTLGYLTPEEAGLSTLVEQELKIRLTFDLVTTEDKSTDLRLGVYLNEKLYNFFVLRDVDPDSLHKTIRLYEPSVPFSIRSVEKKPMDLSVYGF